MKKNFSFTLLSAAAAAALSVSPLPSSAQGSTGSARASGNPYSLIPATTRGYVGASVGWPEVDLACPAGFSCEDPDWGFKVFTGGAWSEVIGVEIGYIDFGSGDRAGGETEARGGYLSVIGNLPLTDTVNIFARVGGTYAFTDVSASPASGVATGDEDGLALHYGAGVGLDLSNNWGLQADWEQHRLKFAGARENVSLYSVGVKYRF